MVSPLLTTDAAVQDCDQSMECGQPSGEFFFQLLHNDPYEKHWHYDSEGNRTYVTLKKRSPFMDGFQKWELHATEEGAFQSGVCSLGDAVVSLVADERIRQLFSTRGYSENVDDIDSMSSGSMSPDLGDLWHRGCPESPEWEGELELGSADDHEERDNAGSADENEDDGVKDCLNQVNDSPLFGFGSCSPHSGRYPGNAHRWTQVESRKIIRFLRRTVVLSHRKRRKRKC